MNIKQKTKVKTRQTSKDLKDQVIGMNIKQKTKVKTRQTSKDIFSNFVGVNELLVLVYSNQDDNTKRYQTSRYYLRIKNY